MRRSLFDCKVSHGQFTQPRFDNDTRVTISHPDSILSSLVAFEVTKALLFSQERSFCSFVSFMFTILPTPTDLDTLLLV